VTPFPWFSSCDACTKSWLIRIQLQPNAEIRAMEQVQLLEQAVTRSFVHLLDQRLAELIHRESRLRRDLQEAFQHHLVAHRHRELSASFDRFCWSSGDGRRVGGLPMCPLELRAVRSHAHQDGGQDGDNLSPLIRCRRGAVPSHVQQRLGRGSWRMSLASLCRCSD
jgi:hypothetical protein